MNYDGRSPQGENMLRTIHFDSPVWVPVLPGILPACWEQHGAAFEDLVESHPKMFPWFDRAALRQNPLYAGLYAAGRQRDCWGNLWENLTAGMIGQVVEHALLDWDAFTTWQRPDPLRDDLLGPRDWDEMKRQIDEKRRRGDVMFDVALPHGFHFLLLSDLRGFQNVMLDMITDDPRLHELVGIIIDYNRAAVRKVLDLGCEFLALAEDLGHQHHLPISLDLWRKWVKPGYEATAGQARDRGIPVYLHSDGHILPILGDLYETGVRVINPQIRANGLAGLREARGKLAICIDLDRQLFPFASPAQLADHVNEVVEALNTPTGGLMVNVEIGPDVPLANVDALFTAIEQACRLPEPEVQRTPAAAAAAR